MTRVLNVFLHEDFVGRLEQDNSGTMRFGYDDAWLASNAALPLSRSLPLQKERFRTKACRPFFAGLLPEEDSRHLIAKTFGVSDKNDFALLERIGAECAGAVSLLPPGELLASAAPQYRPITLGELSEKFAELPRRPLLAGEEGIRLSLAGAQGKLVVAIRDGKFSLPLGGSPSSHILKPKARILMGSLKMSSSVCASPHRWGLRWQRSRSGKQAKPASCKSSGLTANDQWTA